MREDMFKRAQKKTAGGTANEAQRRANQAGVLRTSCSLGALHRESG